MPALEVENIGWNPCGTSEQLLADGSNFTEAKPFAWLATIEPVVPVVRSFTWTVNPAAVSNMCMLSLSPLRMKKSFEGDRLNRAGFRAFAGDVDWPLLVRNAKLAGSRPAEFRQAALFATPVFEFSDNESMLSAAHHRVGSQP